MWSRPPPYDNIEVSSILTNGKGSPMARQRSEKSATFLFREEMVHNRACCDRYSGSCIRIFCLLWRY